MGKKKKSVHAVAMAKDRWKGITKREKSAHGRMMALKRWAKRDREEEWRRIDESIEEPPPKTS